MAFWYKVNLVNTNHALVLETMNKLSKVKEISPKLHLFVTTLFVMK